MWGVKESGMEGRAGEAAARQQFATSARNGAVNRLRRAVLGHRQSTTGGDRHH